MFNSSLRPRQLLYTATSDRSRLVHKAVRHKETRLPIYWNDRNKQPLVIRDGYFYALSFLAVSALVRLLTGSWLWPLLPVPLVAFFLWFFRNPRRNIPQAPGLVVSPADGKVTKIVHVLTPDGGRIRISIFLSVFDVHVNRAPITGVLRSVRYQKGQFLNAMNPDSAARNEQQIAVIEGTDGAGRTTQINLLKPWLEELGHAVLDTP